MHSRDAIAVLSTVALLLVSSAVFCQATAVVPNGETLFLARCQSCHEPAIDRAPTRTELAARAPANIVQH
jgi:cytochrome c5